VIERWQSASLSRKGNISLNLKGVEKLERQPPRGLSSCDQSVTEVILREKNLDAGELPHPTQEAGGRTSPKERGGILSLLAY
jgi:hypothetical protein